MGVSFKNTKSELKKYTKSTTDIKEKYTEYERDPAESYADLSPRPLVDHLLIKRTHDWGDESFDSKIPMIKERSTIEGFQKEWEDWNKLSIEQKMISDRVSVKIRGLTNKEFFDKVSPNIGKVYVTEAFDFSKITNLKDMKAKLFSSIQDEVTKSKVEDIINNFEKDITAIKINNEEYKNRKDQSTAVADITKNILGTATTVVYGAIHAVMGLGIAVTIVIAVTIILALILAGLIYGTICAIFGILNISKMHKDIADKHIFTDILENIKEIGDVVTGEDKNKIKEVKAGLLDNLGMTEKDITQKIKENYNWDDMEFGLDALNADYDDDILDDMNDYDNENVDEESEFYNYAVEKESYNDEEVDALIKRYLKIKDAGTYQKITGMFKDFRNAVRESAKKHGNFFIDTDERDEEKDDKRMMTKAEAIAVVDATLASKYRMYLLAWEHFRRDSARTMSFSLLTVIFFTCLTVSGLIVLLPIAAVIGGTASIGNWYAFFRDLKRTRLIIIKEIERIDNTVSRMAKEENPDKEKMKQLLEIKKALIIQAGYDEKSSKWNKLKDPDVVKKLTEMIDYFGDALSIDDIRLNILEADTEDAATEEPATEESSEEETPAEEGDTAEGDEVEKTGDAEFDEAQEEYLNSDPTEDTGADTFKEGGSEAEENFKLKICLKNLDILYTKYDELKKDIVGSDTYKIVNEDDTNKSKPILLTLVNELSIALDNLKTYIEVGDKSTYPITAVKLSVHQNVLRVIDDTISELITKLNKETLNSLEENKV